MNTEYLGYFLFLIKHVRALSHIYIYKEREMVHATCLLIFTFFLPHCSPFFDFYLY